MAITNHRSLLLAALASAFVACAPGEPPKSSSAALARPSPSAAAAPSALVAPAALEPVSEPPPPVQVAILDPVELAALEANGYGLARLVGGGDEKTTLELAGRPAFKSIFDVLVKDVERTARAHPLARVTSMDGFRLFDTKWLASKEMWFELAGVFNRLDRRPFNPESCGEVRFLYRLRYQTQQGGAAMSSRLPMTLNVVFVVDNRGDDDCRSAARAWQTPRAALAAAERRSLKSVEVNLQSIRLQSSVHPSLAGHIEYVMRVFRPAEVEGGPFAPAPMENMPDTAALAKDRALRGELLEYLKDPKTLERIDLGLLDVPDRFLAKQAISVSPRGLSRLANRPYRQLFSEADFAGLDLSRFPTLRSPAALLRRLDGASCVGCHQSRSIAGFHHVGDDAEATPDFNALVSGQSAHLTSDLPRRQAYVAALAAGEEPAEFRPIPERQGAGRGYAAPCGLGDPGFADWSCDQGLSCKRLEDPEVGACFPESAIGAPCEYGVVHANPKPHRDQVSNVAKHACAERQSCHDNFSGFPLGACGAACSSSAPSSVCGDFLDVDGFQNCLRGRVAHDECARKHVLKTGLRRCDAENPCRQDYVCARTEAEGVGACVPPYFVYQLRLDGYPLRR